MKHERANNVIETENKVNTSPKPSFENLISHQVSDGNWSKGAESTIVKFFSDESIKDATIEGLLAQAKSVGSKEDP